MYELAHYNGLSSARKLLAQRFISTLELADELNALVWSNCMRENTIGPEAVAWAAQRI